MLATNVAGIAWTAWLIFGGDHEESHEEVSAEKENVNISSAPIAMV